MRLSTLWRKIRASQRRIRDAQVFAKATRSPRHPILAHIIPIRRCNLSCSYCNEFDTHSEPVPTAEMLRRVDQLAALGTTIITISGGEPLLHPELEEIVKHTRSNNIIVTLLTNGYLLNPERIGRLNRAGLDQLQISIDNLMPNEVSKKSLKLLDDKLEWLSRYAGFEVSINSALGGGLPNAEDALAIARRALELGFTSTVGLIHDHAGQLVPLREDERRIFRELLVMGKPWYSFAQYSPFQRNLSLGLPNDWHCHAGSRYLYICEEGLVHYCSQRRGVPGIPLAQYTRAHLEREYHTVKPCAPRCTISCVHQVAVLDELREKPMETLRRFFVSEQGQTPSPTLPLPVRILTWLFVTSGKRRVFTKGALRLLGVQ